MVDKKLAIWEEKEGNGKSSSPARLGFVGSWNTMVFRGGGLFLVLRVNFVERPSHSSILRLQTIVTIKGLSNKAILCATWPNVDLDISRIGFPTLTLGFQTAWGKKTLCFVWQGMTRSHLSQQYRIQSNLQGSLLGLVIVGIVDVNHKEEQEEKDKDLPRWKKCPQKMQK